MNTVLTSRGRSSLCSMCHHLDLRLVGELGGQISIDRLGPQGSGVCCWRWCFASEGFTSVVMQPSLRSPLLLLSRAVVVEHHRFEAVRQADIRVRTSVLQKFRRCFINAPCSPRRWGMGRLDDPPSTHPDLSSCKGRLHASRQVHATRRQCQDWLNGLRPKRLEAARPTDEACQGEGCTN